MDDTIYSVPVRDIVQPHALDISDHWKLLRRLKLPDRLNEPSGGTIKRAVVLDVETTGLNFQTDEVIQLAILPFTYEEETGKIIDIEHNRAFNGLRQPKIAISPDAMSVNRITAERVLGEAIDDDAVNAIIDDVSLIIAHNAKFDRAMVEKHWPIFAEKRWECTYSSIKWSEEGFGSSKLELLGLQYGWFYDAHDALADCEACLALLTHTLPKTGRQTLDVILEAAGKAEFLIVATGAPFVKKDLLKTRGYRWRAKTQINGNAWWTLLENADDEYAWLSAEVYNQENKINVVKIDGYNRYSERIWNSF